jgi:hypothetical protein
VNGLGVRAAGAGVRAAVPRSDGWGYGAILHHEQLRSRAQLCDAGGDVHHSGSRLGGATVQTPIVTAVHLQRLLPADIHPLDRDSLTVTFKTPKTMPVDGALANGLVDGLRCDR